MVSNTCFLVFDTHDLDPSYTGHADSNIVALEHVLHSLCSRKVVVKQQVPNKVMLTCQIVTPRRFFAPVLEACRLELIAYLPLF